MPNISSKQSYQLRLDVNWGEISQHQALSGGLKLDRHIQKRQFGIFYVPEKRGVKWHNGL